VIPTDRRHILFRLWLKRLAGGWAANIRFLMLIAGPRLSFQSMRIFWGVVLAFRNPGRSVSVLLIFQNFIALFVFVRYGLLPIVGVMLCELMFLYHIERCVLNVLRSPRSPDPLVFNKLRWWSFQDTSDTLIKTKDWGRPALFGYRTSILLLWRVMNGML